MRNFNWENSIVGKPYQAIHEESSVQKYPIGTIYEDQQGRRYRYCRATEGITYAGLGSPNMAYSPTTGHGNTDLNRRITSVADTEVGDQSLTCLHFAGAHALDDFQGGYISLFDINGSVGRHHSYGLEGSDVSIDTTHTKIHLEEPIDIAITSILNGDLYQSPYRNCGNPGPTVGSYRSVVCIPQIAITASGYYFWGQTRGPCLVWPTAGITAIATREVVFHEDGSYRAMNETLPALQLAGYLMAQSQTNDSCHIMLMLE